MQALSAPQILLDASAAPSGPAAVVPPMVLGHFAGCRRVARSCVHAQAARGAVVCGGMAD